MALLLLPFFMPLLLIGWLIRPEHERELDAREAELDQQFGATWGELFRRLPEFESDRPDLS